MLRFDKGISFSPIIKSNLLVRFNAKRCDSDVIWLMAINDQIRDKKLQCDSNREVAKISA